MVDRLHRRHMKSVYALQVLAVALLPPALDAHATVRASRAKHNRPTTQTSFRRAQAPSALVAPPPAVETSPSGRLLSTESQKKHPRLADIAHAITARRTVDQAELAIKLEEGFRSDPTILQDIDFGATYAKLCLLADESEERLRSGSMSDEAIADLRARRIAAAEKLSALLPRYRKAGDDQGVPSAVPKLRRVISKARELPLAVELPKPDFESGEGLDLQAAFENSKNFAESAKELWGRLNSNSGVSEEELVALQRESKALLSLRAETTKLRGGIRLVQRQKDLKQSMLRRYDADSLLEEALRADDAIMRLQKELSLKSSLLELERIFIVLEAELLSASTLTDQLLPMVDSYGSLEEGVRDMAELADEDQHDAIDDELMLQCEREVGALLLQLGLQGQEPESFSIGRTSEAASVYAKRALQGVTFYARGVQLMGQDVQLMFSMLTRAALQGYTLRAREVKLLRRIIKDLLTIIPFVIILIIPLSPLGHVLVFSFIQRYFPDFFPSQFTESRQNIMEMYSSLTSGDGGGGEATMSGGFGGGDDEQAGQRAGTPVSGTDSEP